MHTCQACKHALPADAGKIECFERARSQLMRAGVLRCKSIDIDATDRANQAVHSADGQFFSAYRISLYLMLQGIDKTNGLAVLK